jgi:hypothetical protein
MAKATFKAIIRHDGGMVAAMAAVVGGKARFFVAQRKETSEMFIGRVSQWVKSQGADGLEMQSPDALPEGVEAGEVIMRLKHALGIGRGEDDAAEYDVENAELVWSGADPAARPS